MIANTINNLRIAIGNIISDYENMDLIRPNRLQLGRNNDRSAAATMEVTGNPDRILKKKKKNFRFTVRSLIDMSCTKTDESS